MHIRSTLTRLAAVAVIVSCLVAPAPAQEARPSPPAAEVGAINTNRPTQGTNTGVVGPGTFQIETGCNLTTFKGGAPSLSQFVAQFRIGLGSSTEVNISTPLHNRLHGAGVRGLGDTNVGFKWQMASWKTDDGTATFAIIPNATFRTGDPAFRNPGTVGQLILSADIPVGKPGQNLTLNLAGTSLVDGASQQRFGQVFGAAYYTFPVSPTTSAWVELSGFGPDASSGGAFIASVDTGMSFALGKDDAFDFDVLKGLGPRGADWFFTVGYSHRFRTR